MKIPQYFSKKTRSIYTSTPKGLKDSKGNFIPYLMNNNLETSIPDFTDQTLLGTSGRKSLDMYETEKEVAIYRNFLDWMFSAFREDEIQFRQDLANRLNLKNGDKVLITGCGMGDDIPSFFDLIGSSGEIYAQDLSSAMVMWAQKTLSEKYPTGLPSIHFFAGNAEDLPFADNYFDAAYHFGGINLFDNVKKAIEEMNRVVRIGGRVLFGDEGIAPWLIDKEYGKIAVANNSLWSASAPITLLPEKCIDVSISWVLGNCFYIVNFKVDDSGPFMDIDLYHKGRRGGSPRTRYFGQLEGVTPETKQKVLLAASQAGISIHEWLEKVINKSLS